VKGRNVSSEDIVRAWKDPDYVGPAGDNPAGDIALENEYVGGSYYGTCGLTIYNNCTLGTGACGGGSVCGTCGYIAYDNLGNPIYRTYCV
jgi:hypothetical protein